MRKSKKSTKPANRTHVLRPFALLFVLIVILGLGYYGFRLLFYPQSIDINQVTGGTGTVTLALTPATSTLAANTTTDLTLTINAGNKHVSGAQVEITFDPAKCVTPTVTQGSFLTGSPLVPATVANGKIKFTFAAPPASGGVTGSGTLATITTGPKSGSCTLSFTSNTLVTTTENLTGNSLASASDARLSVPGAPSPSSTPTPSLTPTPIPSSPGQPCPSGLTPAQCTEWRAKINARTSRIQRIKTCLAAHSLSYCLSNTQ